MVGWMARLDSSISLKSKGCYNVINLYMYRFAAAGQLSTAVEEVELADSAGVAVVVVAAAVEPAVEPAAELVAELAVVVAAVAAEPAAVL